jgi:hypothetical protein
MKMFATMFALTLMSAIAYGQQVTGVPLGASPSPSNSGLLSDVLNVPEAMPLGPRDLLQQYESQMAAISNDLGEELSQVLAAVQTGELDPDMADYISEHNYEIAMMQFQLLSVLHGDLTKSIADEEAEPDQQMPANDSSPSGSSTALRQTKAHVEHINRNTSAADQGSAE